MILGLLFLSSCTGGEELCSVEGKDYIYRLYGSANSITRVSVTDRESGEVISEISPEYRVNEPWLGDEKNNYGFELRDLNSDGHEDFIIKTVRTEGAEKYLFYIYSLK